MPVSDLSLGCPRRQTDDLLMGDALKICSKYIGIMEKEMETTIVYWGVIQG